MNLRYAKSVGWIMLIILSTTSALKAEETKKQEDVVGDVRRVAFHLPFDKALKVSREQGRLLLLKPIFGGVDAKGAKDHRCGTW